ncbi:CE1759 family FMN reductase [Janibacter sp. G56]|uniref:CE1759 family FMN reductase n=1 Tax=Janibacter sp. G56 TaxID=3418717 RepID=UPI003D063B5D
MRRVVVISAGLRKPSSTRLLADLLGDASARALRDLGEEVEVEVVELRDHAHDLTNALLSGFASEELQGVLDRVAHADGLIAVTPIFSASYNGLFKSFFDVLPEGGLHDKPVLLGATAGTARHSLALEFAVRPLMAYLKADTVSTSVFAASEDWGATAGAGQSPAASEGTDGAIDDSARDTATQAAHGSLRARAIRAGAEFAAEVHARGDVVVPDEFAVVDFTELLRGAGD